MAIITYVDQYPNTANTGQIGTSTNPYDCITTRCSFNTVGMCSPQWCHNSDMFVTGGDLCVCSGAGTGWCDICGQNVYATAGLHATNNVNTPQWCNAGSDVTINNGDLCVCQGSGGGWCDICGGAIVSSGNTLCAPHWLTTGTWICPLNSCCVCGICSCYGTVTASYVYTSVTCTNYLCDSSQGCICVYDCLMDCDGNEILGGVTSPWLDQTGYYCLESSCPACAASFCGGHISVSCLDAQCWCYSGAVHIVAGPLCVSNGSGTMCDICGGNIYSNGSQITGGPWSNQTGYYCLENSCAVCATTYNASGGFSGSCVVLGSGYSAADILCNGSQGCICVCSCLIDCNGAEILGGGAGLWADGAGCVYLASSCVACVCNCCGSSGYTAGMFTGGCCSNGVLGCADCWGCGVTGCSCCGYGGYFDSYYSNPLVAYSGSGCQALMCNGVTSCGYFGCDCCVAYDYMGGQYYMCFCGGIFVCQG